MNEAMGKILGMAMAYGVSSLGLLLAYVNYRKRIVKAERVMSPQAWGVIAASVVAVALGAGVVASLAARAETTDAKPAPIEAEAGSAAAVQQTGEAPPPPTSDPSRDRWPLVGIVVPGTIFLLATWITGALHRRFSASGHGPGTKGEAG